MTKKLQLGDTTCDSLSSTYSLTMTKLHFLWADYLLYTLIKRGWRQRDGIMAASHPSYQRAWWTSHNPVIWGTWLMQPCCLRQAGLNSRQQPRFLPIRTTSKLPGTLWPVRSGVMTRYLTDQLCLGEITIPWITLVFSFEGGWLNPE